MRTHPLPVILLTLVSLTRRGGSSTDADDEILHPHPHAPASAPVYQYHPQHEELLHDDVAGTGVAEARGKILQKFHNFLYSRTIKKFFA